VAAAQFMYEDGAAHRLTLYVRANAAPSTAFRFAQADGYSAFFRVNAGLGIAVVAAIDRAQLREIAEEADRQMVGAATSTPAR
jgi:anti-sigma factor RsiW